MPTLKIFQVYFDDSQLQGLDYIPYYNKSCTPYFENKVMVDLIKKGEHKNCSHFGVLSHKFKEKIIERTTAQWEHLPNFKNHSRITMDAEHINQLFSFYDPAVLSLMQHPSHDPITYSANFHKLLPKFFKEVVNKIGNDWQPEIFERVYYSNYFIARKDIYADYVKNMLAPAIKVMDEMPELWQDSGYAFKLPEHLKQQWNVNYYPYHSFVLERLFSYYCHINKDQIWKNTK